MKPQKPNDPRRKKSMPKAPIKKGYPQFNLKAFVSRVRALRLKHNWNQTELGKHLGLSMTAYAAFEQKRISISLNSVMIIKNLFNVSYDYLFEGLHTDSGNLLSEIKRRDIEIEVLKSEIESLKKTNEIYKDLIVKK